MMKKPTSRLPLAVLAIVMLFSLALSASADDASGQGVLQPFPNDVFSGHSGNNVGQNTAPTSITGWCTTFAPYQCIATNTGGSVCTADVQCQPGYNNNNPPPNSSPTPAPTLIFVTPTPSPTPTPAPASTSTSTSAPTITAFDTSPAFITAGQSATLSWATTGATWVSIDQLAGLQNGSGSVSVSPTTTTTYTITAGNTFGTTTAITTLTVDVNANTNTNTPSASPTIATLLPIATLTASSGSIPSGETFILSWTSERATTVTIDQGIGNVSTSGSRTIQPLGSTTYTIVATNSVGSVSTHITVAVVAPSPLPVATIGASAGTIVFGESFTLTWTDKKATTVTIDQGIGVVSASGGSKIVKPLVTTTYTITATNAFGTVTTHITVVVISVASLLDLPGGTLNSAPVFSSTDFSPPIFSTTDPTSETTIIDAIVNGTNVPRSSSNGFLKNWYWWAIGIIAIGFMLVLAFALGVFKKRDL